MGQQLRSRVALLSAGRAGPGAVVT